MREIKKVGIYARVSTGDKKQTPDTQLDALINYCKSMGWDYETFIDIASGTKTENRPGYQDLLKAIDTGAIDLVLVWSVDRLGRNTKQLLSDWDRLKTRGVHFRSFSQPIDTTLPGGELIYQFISILSEWEIAGKKSAIKAGQARARSRGRVPGRPGISETKRRRVLKAKGENKNASYGELAKICKMPKSTIYKILNDQKYE